MHHAHTTSLPSLIATKKMNEIWFLKFSGRRSWVLAFGVLVFCYNRQFDLLRIHCLVIHTD